MDGKTKSIDWSGLAGLQLGVDVSCSGIFEYLEVTAPEGLWVVWSAVAVVCSQDGGNKSETHVLCEMVGSDQPFRVGCHFDKWNPNRGCCILVKAEGTQMAPGDQLQVTFRVHAAGQLVKEQRSQFKQQRNAPLLPEIEDQQLEMRPPQQIFNDIWFGQRN